jgi:hypothetical protein
MRRILLSLSVAVVALSAPATAQRATTSAGSASPSPELGMDAGASFGLGDNSGTTIAIPAQQLRIGFFVSPAFSIEPTFGLVSHSGGGLGSVTSYAIGAGLLYHLSTNRATNQLYLRPFVEVDGVSVGGTNGGSNSITIVGMGVGVKVPLRDRIASRFEANFAHADGSDAIGLLAGLSFYTR